MLDWLKKKKKVEEGVPPEVGEDSTLTTGALRKFLEQLDHLTNTKPRERRHHQLRRFSHSCLLLGDGSGTILRHSTQALEDVVIARFQNEEQLKDLLTKAYQIIKVK